MGACIVRESRPAASASPLDSDRTSTMPIAVSKRTNLEREITVCSPLMQQQQQQQHRTMDEGNDTGRVLLANTSENENDVGEVLTSTLPASNASNVTMTKSTPTTIEVPAAANIAGNAYSASSMALPLPNFRRLDAVGLSSAENVDVSGFDEPTNNEMEGFDLSTGSAKNRNRSVTDSRTSSTRPLPLFHLSDRNTLQSFEASKASLQSGGAGLRTETTSSMWSASAGPLGGELPEAITLARFSSS